MEWEQCKENIKPRREGRNLSTLNTTPKENAIMAKIQERQSEFEQEIKHYEGDDELKVWTNYVNFTVDSFPEGDFQSQVCAIQLRLVKRFQNMEKYKQDARLLNAFIDLANHSPDPSEVYGYCYYHDLVTTFAIFWSNWINCWIYKQRYDKALKICEKAIKVFHKTTTFKGMKFQILRLMNTVETESLIPISEFRKIGSKLEEDTTQQQRPGPTAHSNSTLNKFSILKDKTEHSPTIPSSSINPLERSVQNKENSERKPQRWKNIVSEATTPRVTSASAFNVLQEDLVVKNDQFQTNTTALKAKKMLEQVNPVQFKQLNPATCVTQSVAYQKSKVYPGIGEEWSFEELEARRRSDQSYESPKRTLLPEDKTESESKKNCLDQAESSLASFKLENFTADFNFDNTLVSSTKKIYYVDDSEPVMVPNFKDLITAKEHLTMSLSIRHEDVLSGTVNKSEKVPDVVQTPPRCVFNVKSEVSADQVVDSQEADFSCAMPLISAKLDCKSLFDVYEDLDVPLHETKQSGAIIDSHKPLNTILPEEAVSPQSKEFQIFSEFHSEAKDKPDDSAFTIKMSDIDFGDISLPSDAFNIFAKSPKADNTAEESSYDGSHVSYSLKTVVMTPCDKAASTLFVPCTIERMGKQSKGCDTQVINKQVLNMLNDCSRISDVTESIIKPAEMKDVCCVDFKSFQQIDDAIRSDNAAAEGTKTIQKVAFTAATQTSSELSVYGSDITFPTMEGIQNMESIFDRHKDPAFIIFNDSFTHDTLLDSIPVATPSCTETSCTEKNQLTPILEGSRESECSVESLVTCNVMDKSKTKQSGGIVRLSVEGTSKFDNVNYEVPATKEKRPLTPLFPDKTQRDVHFDVSMLTKVPRTSLIPTQPVSDPYEQALIDRLIQSLDPPLCYKINFNQFDKVDLKPGRQLKLGLMDVQNVVKIGEGAFAHVFSGECYKNGVGVGSRAFKIQSPPAPWEFHIISELMDRMSKYKIAKEVKEMILPMLCVYVYRNMSVLVTSLFTEGSLLDMMNHYRKERGTVPASVICTYTLDMLRCVDALHKVQIIHGDIKPDNWLLRDKENTMHSMSMLMTKSVVLIDFGRSIDMQILPHGSVFTVSSNTEMFECIEMTTNRPWTFQVDYYGVLSCVHLMMHNEYMKVYFDKAEQVWKPTKAAHRRVDKELFSSFFIELLNIKDCDSIPALTKYIHAFQKYLKSIMPKSKHQQLKDHYIFMSKKLLDN